MGQDAEVRWSELERLGRGFRDVRDRMRGVREEEGGGRGWNEEAR